MMPRSRKHCLAYCALVLLLLLGACSNARKDSAESRHGKRGIAQQTDAGIVPSPAYAFHELRISEAATAALGSSMETSRIRWVVNGSEVHSGESLAPTYIRAGAKVTAIVESSDGAGGWRELTHFSCVVKNSPPRVEEVQLERDQSNPYHIQAVLRATDSDEQAVDLHYRWFLNGKAIPDQLGDSIVLNQPEPGSEVQVEVVASDGQASSVPVRSPKLKIEAPTVFLTVGERAEFRDTKDGGREVILPLQYTDGARLQLLDAPSNVRFEPGHLVWAPKENEKEVKLSVRVSAKDGSTVEREITLNI